jgi:hypothetical protein
MLKLEAAILASVLDEYEPSSILDIGSGTRIDREIIQPHISAAFNGHKVIWTDKQVTPGAIKVDITDPKSLVGLPMCEMVTAFSVLEHVEDIDSAINGLRMLTIRWLVVSVPCSYPEHKCPIDNLWRPGPQELGDRLAQSGLRIEELYQSPPEVFEGVENASASIAIMRV